MSVSPAHQEITPADAGKILGVSSAELDELVVLGFLRPRRVVNGIELFLRGDVDRVTPAQISVARRLALLTADDE